ncbi:hypothetical protein GEMRC1_005651 [Eukaryota sp. GEM-RC1]
MALPSRPTREQMAKAYFTPISRDSTQSVEFFQNSKIKNPETAQLWKCVCGVLRTKQPNSGWTNLASHVPGQHTDYMIETWTLLRQKEQNLPIDRVYTSEKCRRYFSWLDWVITDGLPFSFVQNDCTLEYTKLKPIAYNTFMQCFDNMKAVLVAEISVKLGSCFGLVIDSWQHPNSKLQFLGIFGSCEQLEKPVLLKFVPFSAEEGRSVNSVLFGAEDIARIVDELLLEYSKERKNIIFIVADNCSTMKALSKLLNCGFVGCASHRFQLAVTAFIRPLDALLDRVNSVMKLLREPKRITIFRNYTKLAPKQRNVTRWYSTHDMLKRFLELKLPIGQMLNEVEDDELIDLLPSFAEETRIIQLMYHMKELQFVSLQLQKENSNLLDAEHLFKSAMLVFCQYNANQEMKNQLVYPAVDAPRCPPNQFIFESAVLKILKNEGLSLSDEEEIMVKCFKEHEIETVAGQSRLSSSLDGEVIVNNVSSDSDDDGEEEIDERPGPVSSVQDVFTRMRGETVGYCNLKFIPATSNVVERLFSKARMAQGLSRHNLSDRRLANQLFLSVNREFWDISLVRKMVNQKLVNLDDA